MATDRLAEIKARYDRYGNQNDLVRSDVPWLIGEIERLHNVTRLFRTEATAKRRDVIELADAEIVRLRAVLSALYDATGPAAKVSFDDLGDWMDAIDAARAAAASVLGGSEQ